MVRTTSNAPDAPSRLAPKDRKRVDASTADARRRGRRVASPPVWWAALLVIALLTLVGTSGASPAHAADGAAPRKAATGTMHPQGGRMAGDARSLGAFFTALGKLERGPAGMLSILQIGDSHTAGNHFSGTLRGLFQERFGNAGPGGFPPGPAYKGLFSPTVTLGPQTWTLSGGLNAKPGDRLGISGFSASSVRPDEALRFDSADNAPVSSIVLTLVGRSGGGGLLITADGKPVRSLATARTQEGGFVARLKLPQPAHSIVLSPKGDGRVELLRVALLGAEKGVYYESHGVIGATIGLLQRWDEATVIAELQVLRPALIVLAFGTNEGFNSSLTEDAYRTLFRERLAALRRWAPWASVLVVGPPDANRLPKGCPAEATAACSPTPPPSGTCAWHPPAELAMVREVERKEALAAGAAFWDWSAVMGGACGTHAWTRNDPPLAASDHVHFRPDGYRRAAQALFDDLMGLYRTTRPPAIPGVAPRPALRPPQCRSTAILNGTIHCLR